MPSSSLTITFMSAIHATTRYTSPLCCRLDGAIYAASNAALMLAQTGQEEAAIKEMQKIARRAPGSADMRVALASLYWSKGEEAAAESEWEFACNKITGE